jgi:hypothetical protein
MHSRERGALVPKAKYDLSVDQSGCMGTGDLVGGNGAEGNDRFGRFRVGNQGTRW